MTEAAIKAVQRRVPVIVQVGAASLSEAVDLAAHAEAAGADAISSGGWWEVGGGGRKAATGK